MSVVVCKVEKDEIVLASDSQVTHSEERIHVEHNHPKVLKIYDNCGFGLVGTPCGAYFLEDYLRDKVCKKEDKFPTEKEVFRYMITFYTELTTYLKGSEDPADAIIILEGNAYYWSRGFVKKITGYDATGNGYEFALGALFSNSSVETAVNAACRFTNTCGLPYQEIRFKRSIDGTK